MLAEAEVLTPFRCSRCWELEEENIETLLCNVCHYVAPPAFAPPPPMDSDPARRTSTHRERLALSAEERDRYDYWLELTLGAGWEPAVARRAALDRVRSQPSA